MKGSLSVARKPGSAGWVASPAGAVEVLMSASSRNHVPEPDSGNHRSTEGWQEESLTTLAEMRPVIERVMAAMGAVGFSEFEKFGLHLALEEVIVNAIKHGNRNDPTKRAQVRWQVQPDRVLVEVEDEGPGFNPTAVPDPTAPENLDRPGGRGLLLIRAYTTWAEYNERGNRVTLCKLRSAVPS